MYKLEIEANNFEYDTVCLGWQLAKILMNFTDFKDTKWLVFDVYGTTHDDILQLFITDEAGRVTFDSTESLIVAVEKVIQFESGVFCLVSNSNKIEVEDDSPETESPEGMQIENALLEVRAFDYTFFEVYSHDKEYLEKIKKNLLIQDNLNLKVI